MPKEPTMITFAVTAQNAGVTTPNGAQRNGAMRHNLGYVENLMPFEFTSC
jgi:hypothetical protein